MTAAWEVIGHTPLILLKRASQEQPAGASSIIRSKSRSVPRIGELSPEI